MILQNKIIKLIMKVISTIFMIFVILYLSFILIQRINGNKSIFGYRLFTVVTPSMEPIYNVNDVVIVRDIKYNDVKIGDDVAYLGKIGNLSGKIITHRVIDIDNSSSYGKVFTTKGVNNKYADPPVMGNQIVGKVEGKLFIINKLNHILKNKYGFFFLVFCPLILIMSFDIAQAVIEAKIDKGELISIDRGNIDEEDDVI